MSVRQEAKDRTRAALLDAADRVFVEHGFHGARVAAIAAAAGYTTGAVYALFAGKDDLFLAVLDRRRDLRLAEIDALRQAGASADEAAAQWFARISHERAWHLVSLEFQLHAARDPELNARYRERHDALVEAAAAAAAAHRAGGPRTAVGRAAIAVGNGYAMQRLTDPESVADAELAVAMMAALSAIAKWDAGT